MAFTATSSMVVDLSGDNDNAGALAAAATIPSANADSPFERSCDNPECSAPKLISLVPKRETPEFITEPVIMNQPTLINGFTTVFQIDGIGARMNDIMYGDQGGSATSNGTAHKPKSVFRIVPNTHAHIVNYVVVDGAGETMRKIKANDADTMRKLLDSQRLSAEQMLKKLIGKAFKTPVRQTEPQVALPITAEATAPIPVSGPMPANVLPAVPPGITITPIPLSDGLHVGKSNPALMSSPPKAVKQTPATNVIVSKPTTSAVATFYSSTTATSKTTATATAPTATAPKTNTSTATAPAATATKTTTPAATLSTTTPTTTVSTRTTPSSTVSTRATSKAHSSSTPILRRVLATRSADQAKSPDPGAARYGRPNILKRKLLTTPVPEAIKRLRPRSPKQKTPLATGLIPTTTTPPPPLKKLPTLPKLPTKPPAAIPPVKSTPQPKKVADTVPLAKAPMKSAAKESMKEAAGSTPEANSTPNEALTSKAGIESPNKPAALPTRKLMVAPTLTKENLPEETAHLDNSFLKCNESLPVKPKPLMGPASKMNALKAIAAAKAITAQASAKAELSNKLSTALASKSAITKIGETVITSSGSLASKADTSAIIKPCSVSIEQAEIPTHTIFKSNDYLNKERSATAPKPNALTTNVTSKPETTSPSKLTAPSDSKATAQSASKAKVTAALTTKPADTASTPKGNAAVESKASTQSASKTNTPAVSKPTDEEDPLAIDSAKTIPTSTSKVSGTATAHKIGETPSKANTPKAEGGPSGKIYLGLTTRVVASKVSAALAPKSDGISTPKSDQLTNPKANLTPAPSNAKSDATSVSKTNVASIKTVASISKAEAPAAKVTRSSTPKLSAASTPTAKTDRVSTPTTKSVAVSPENSEASSTPVSSQSRTLRVVLPTLKGGVMTIPTRSPHPNLKISSVISGGTAVAAATSRVDQRSSISKMVSDDNSPDIEKLQQELAVLRRTVARLTRKKT